MIWCSFNSLGLGCPTKDCYLAAAPSRRIRLLLPDGNSVFILGASEHWHQQAQCCLCSRWWAALLCGWCQLHAGAVPRLASHHVYCFLARKDTTGLCFISDLDQPWFCNVLHSIIIGSKGGLGSAVPVTCMIVVQFSCDYSAINQLIYMCACSHQHACVTMSHVTLYLE